MVLLHYKIIIVLLLVKEFFLNWYTFGEVTGKMLLIASHALFAMHCPA